MFLKGWIAKCAAKKYQKNPETVQKFAVQKNADLKLVDLEKKLMLKKEPTLTIGGADTAENGPLKVRQVSNKTRHILGPL